MGDFEYKNQKHIVFYLCEHTVITDPVPPNTFKVACKSFSMQPWI